MEEIIKKLDATLFENLSRNEPMEAHTTMKVGGVAEYFLNITNPEDFQKIISFCSLYSFPFFVLGAGSNIIVADDGVKGLVISTKDMKRVEVTGNKIYAEAGTTLGKLAQKAYEHGLTGLEFASGIPGSVGGGLYMNAGAYDGSMRDVTQEAWVLDRTLILNHWDQDALQMSYRSTRLMRERAFVLAGVFQLEKGKKTDILAKMHDFNHRRQAKQPLEYPSCGSIFKRPKDNFAGKLIMEAGLSGYRKGGAQVSPKHCGFIVNTDNATSEDLVFLMAHIREEVKKKFNIYLEAEVEFVGAFGAKEREKIKQLLGY